jgi:hypothetical protein
VPKGENSCQKPPRSRESEVWGRVVELVGPPAADVRFAQVFDRGADNLDVFRMVHASCACGTRPKVTLWGDVKRDHRGD